METDKIKIRDLDPCKELAKKIYLKYLNFDEDNLSDKDMKAEEAINSAIRFFQIWENYE